jgi:hypothetical protein
LSSACIVALRRFGGDHDAVLATVLGRADRTVALEAVVHDGFARRGGEHPVAQADESPGRDFAFDVHAVAALVERLDLAAARPDEFEHRSDAVLVHIHRQEFDRLAAQAVDRLLDDLRPADREFVALAAHVLEQDPEVQQAATGDAKLIGALARFDAEREVGRSSRSRRSASWREVTYLPSCPRTANR